MVTGGEENPEYYPVSAPDSDTVQLRFRREGNTFTAYASEDGTNWQLIGTHRGEIDPDDFETVDNDPALVRIPILKLNILYIGFTNTFAPFDDNVVRQAVAMAIDRQRIVDNFYARGSP